MKKIISLLLALMMVLSVLSMAVFAEPVDPGTEPDDNVPDIDVTEPGNEPGNEPEQTAPDENPPMGVALAVIPMALAGACVAFSKKR